MKSFFTILCSFFLFTTVNAGNRVLELSDRFLEIRDSGVWLVMFYAPWCGHCKNLEPIWNQVAQSLVDTDVRVGRLDCTRFTSVATEFSVAGFPTILFIKGHKTVEYKGDRDRSEIVEFARRMNGPAVHHLTICDQFETLRNSKKVFIMFVDGGTEKVGDDLKDSYLRIAEEFQTVMSFYTVPLKCISSLENVTLPKAPSVYVCKDNTCFHYEEDLYLSKNITLYEWINKERFPTFLKITNGNFHQLLKSGKNIVMAVLEENQIGGLTLRMSEFRDVVEAIAINNKNIYHEHFVFGWCGQPDIANTVAMEILSIPSLIVVNTTTYQYYLPTYEETEKIPSPQNILLLLDQIKENQAEALGGDTYFYKFYRIYFNARTSLIGMWKGNPVLTTVLLGLPLGLLSIICYTICCSDILEAGDEEEEEQADERHHKKE